MKTLVPAFIGLCVGILAMGGTVWNIQENAIFLILYWAGKQIFYKFVMEPAAKELGLPPKEIFRQVAAQWIRERESVKHYMNAHTGSYKDCKTCP